ncbi:MAG: M4 family metallopeptidase [Flavobacteriia bacterium]|nr:M4 family metallopeptidase [Flavobacteriia bacterium]
MIKNYLLFSSFFIFSLVFSQEFSGNEALKYVPKSSKVKINPIDNTIQFFQLAKNANIKATNCEQYLLNTLHLTNDYSFSRINQTTSKSGLIDYKFQLYYKGIKIEKNIYNIHINNNLIESANGCYAAISKFNVLTPNISPEQAIEIGKNFIQGENYFWSSQNQPKPELVFYQINNEFLLSYKADIYATKPLNRQYLYIDAIKGTIIHQINRIQHNDVIGTAHTKYNGVRSITTDNSNNTYFLSETSRGNGINTYNLNTTGDYSSATLFSDNDNNWNSTQNQDDAALDVHFGSEVFYDYFSQNFGYNSFDNANAQINAYVHYNLNFVNAFWDGSSITFGDGDGIEYNALTSLDVVGHELTHAITQYTAGLEYIDESGALNESFSDIFGVILDYSQNPTTANFQIGDQFAINGNFFRDMSNPNSKGHPDTYLGNFWITDGSDNGGVHTNSNVQNYWFYLLVNGGNGTNDLNNFYSMNGIGMQKSAEICFRTLSNYLVPSSNYEDARYYSIKAAEDLYGYCSPEVIAVTNAWYAVGIGNLFSPDVTSNFSVSSTYSCTIPATITFNNISTNGNSYIWDFGDGSSSTLENPTHTYTNQGTYNVMLIVSGTGDCNTTDTTFIPNYLNITNNGGPLSPNCAPQTLYPYNSFGLSSFTFNDLIYTAASSISESYKDLSCNYTTTVTAGLSYILSIQTGSLQHNKIWVDLNNDGNFEESELIYISNSQSTSTNTSIIIPGNCVYNTPLRMRLGTDIQHLFNACSQPHYGQVIDYAITILPNNNPPIANFSTTSTNQNINTPVAFNDLSLNVPTTWEWTFEGADILHSNQQNPTVSYSNIGTYFVKLKVTNQYGEDSITKISYINILNQFTMCSSFESNAPTGILYDSGVDQNYSDNEYCSFLIHPNSQGVLTLHINSFYSEENFDYLSIYDGSSQNGNLIAYYSGTIPYTSFESTTGNFFLIWYSDSYINNNGFNISWDSYLNIESQTTENSILYPNPTNSMIYIKKNFDFTTLTLKNNLGQNILTITNENTINDQLIDLSNFSDGIYFIEFQCENNNVVNQKIIKNSK